MSTNRGVVEIVRILLKWRVLILVVTFLGIAGSVIVALMLPNYYKSTAVFYPQNLSVFDRGYLFGTESKEKVQSLFGDKQDVNRLLSIANSTELLSHLIDHYSLADHYGVDTNAKDWRYKVYREFEGNYKVLKSDLDNVELSIWDQNARLSSEMVNYMVGQIDQIYSSLVKQRNSQNVETVEAQVNRIQAELDTISDQLSGYSDTTRSMYKMLAKRQGNLLEDLSYWKSLFNQYRAAADYNVSSLFIIEQAYPAERKDRPVRWLIVVSATLVAFFLSAIAAILFEKYKEIKAEIAHD